MGISTAGSGFDMTGEIFRMEAQLVQMRTEYDERLRDKEERIRRIEYAIEVKLSQLDREYLDLQKRKVELERSIRETGKELDSVSVFAIARKRELNAMLDTMEDEYEKCEKRMHRILNNDAQTLRSNRSAQINEFNRGLVDMKTEIEHMTAELEALKQEAGYSAKR